MTNDELNEANRIRELLHRKEHYLKALDIKVGSREEGSTADYQLALLRAAYLSDIDLYPFCIAIQEQATLSIQKEINELKKKLESI